MNFVSSFEDFKEVLHQHEEDIRTKYVYEHGRKSFSREKVEITPELKVHWYDEVPYFHFGTRVYQCHHGKDNNKYQKEKYAKQRAEKCQVDQIFTKCYKEIKTCKKVGCPAKIKVTRIFRMLKYKVQGSPTPAAKAKASAVLKRELLKFGSVTGEEGYIFNLPSADEHKFHFVEVPAAVNESIDECVEKHTSLAPLSVLSPLSPFGKHKHRASKRKSLINDCCTMIRSIQSMVNDLPEENLAECLDNLKTLFRTVSQNCSKDEDMTLPFESTGKSEENLITRRRNEDKYDTLASHKKMKIVHKVSATADRMKDAQNTSVEHK